MKSKTINAVISKKFDDLLASIKDDNVKKLVKKNTIITGGCITSMLLKETVNDYDLYFTNKQTVLAVCDYYVKQFNAENGDDLYVLDGAEYAADIANGSPKYGGIKGVNLTPDRVKIICESNGVAAAAGFLQPHEEDAQPDTAPTEIGETKAKFRPIYMSSNAITLTDQIQMVIRFYGDASEIHDNYDFVHCTNFWLSENKSLSLNQPALESILSKELRYIGSKYPLASVIRTRKFIGRGWTINAGQYLKMCFQVSLLDLTNIDVLEDQLTGVDMAYFGVLITALRGAPANTLSYGYLAEIIDRIF